MRRISLGLAVAVLLIPTHVRADELKAEHVLNVKGDGADGKGNTDDDTWGFWFEVVHNHEFHRLSLATAKLTPEQRKNGVSDPTAKRGKGKVRGPVASLLPDSENLDGWIFHRDWDGRFEGIWANKSTGAIMAHPYAEKSAHCAVAISYKIPKAGAYAVTAKLTDLAVNTTPPHDGILWRLDKVSGGKSSNLAKGGPIGDGKGPESESFGVPRAEFAQGELVRLVIHPNRHWGQDLTRIDYFKIEPAREGK